jgi:Protein of unknown function (DUF1585)
LENFDVIGGWRDWYRLVSPGEEARSVRLPHYPRLAVWRGPDVEQGFRTAEGEPMADIREFRSYLLKDSRQIVRNLTERLLTYATASPPQFADQVVIDQIIKAVEAKGLGFRSLIKEVVASRMFLEQ